MHTSFDEELSFDLVRVYRNPYDTRTEDVSVTGATSTEGTVLPVTLASPVVHEVDDLTVRGAAITNV